jgi:hypothetical protein
MTTPAALDPSLLVLTSDDEDFLKAITRIDDAQELRDHIQRVGREAYEVSWRNSNRQSKDVIDIVCRCFRTDLSALIHS